MATTTMDLATPDGLCRTTLSKPDAGQGPWPAVIFGHDGMGVRTTMVQMAERLAASGYVVALPDLFYRGGSPRDLLPEGLKDDPIAFLKVLGDPALREQWRTRFAAPAMNPDNNRADIGAVFAQLDADPDVKKGPAGCTGYCMGGHIALRLAALFPDRIAAAASFHGGGLATPAPDSPHLGAPQIKARVYIGGAKDDASFNDEAKALLEEALSDAGVDHVIETYPALHGFAVPDNPTYDEEAGERHFKALTDLLSSTLSKG